MKNRLMVLSRNYKRGYFKASSLVESIIAITIIAICLLIALRLYINVLESGPSADNQRAKFKVNALVEDMKLNQNFDSEVYGYKTYKISKEVTDYQNRNNLKKVSYTVQCKTDTITYDYLIVKKNAEE